MADKKVDIRVVESAPEVPIDEVKKQATLLHLKNNRQTAFYKKPLFLSVAAFLVISLAVFVNPVVTFDWRLNDVTPEGSQQKVYQDEFTGTRYGYSNGDSLDAVRVMQSHALAHREIDSVVRWKKGDDYVFNVLYKMEEDGGYVAEIPDIPRSSPSAKLMSFLASKAPGIEASIIETGPEPYETEILIVDGVPVEFQKWKITTPNNEDVEFWNGKPTSPNHLKTRR